jgi:NAD dependent epimerase/dehydratase
MNLRNKRVLVTGAGGFIASHLVERLLGDGASVKALVRYNSLGSWGWLQGHQETASQEDLEILSGDIRDPKFVADAVEGCDVVFHLAALIAIPYSYQAPGSYVDTNISGTLNVLVAAQSKSIRVVHTSTSEVYGTPHSVPITEAHPLQGQSPYSATKIAADKLAESFYCSFDLPVTVLRPFNTYGPRQSARAVLPTILTQLIAGKKEIRLGALWPRRDLTFVDDTVDGFIKAATREEAIGRTVHLGTGRAISIGDLVQLAITTLKVEAEVVSEDERMRPEKSEVGELLSDPSLAAEVLGWQPKVSLEQGIATTAEWLKENLAHYDVERYSR